MIFQVDRLRENPALIHTLAPLRQDTHLVCRICLCTFQTSDRAKPYLKGFAHGHCLQERESTIIEQNPIGPARRVGAVVICDPND